MSGYRYSESPYTRRSGKLHVKRLTMWNRLVKSVFRWGRRGVVLAGLGAVAWAGNAFITTSPSFAVRSVVFKEGHRVEPSDFSDTLEKLNGVNIFKLSLRELRESVELHPWVRQARVYRRLPNSIDVVLEEYRPLALIAGGQAALPGSGDWFWLDETGETLIAAEVSEWEAGLSRPLVVGLDHDTSPEIMQRTSAALLAVRDESPDLFRRIAVFDIRQAGRLEVILRDRPETLWLHPEDAARNLRRLEGLWPELERKENSRNVVDLRWQNQIAVRPKAIAATSTHLEDSSHG